MTTLDLYDQRCPECESPVTPPTVRCCCERCGHPLDDHSAGLDCRTCGWRCGIQCTSMLQRLAAGRAESEAT